MSKKAKNSWATELFKLARQLASKVTRAQAAVILVVIVGLYVLTYDLGIMVVSNLGPNLVAISFGFTVIVIGAIVLYALRAITRMQYAGRRKTEPSDYQKFGKSTTVSDLERLMTFDVCPECGYKPMVEQPDGDWACPRCGFVGRRVSDMIMRTLHPMISSLGWQILEVAKDSSGVATDTGTIANALDRDNKAVYEECVILRDNGFLDFTDDAFGTAMLKITGSGLQALRDRREK